MRSAHPTSDELLAATREFAAIQTTAKRGTHGWLLQGHKAWIVNAMAADVVFAYAQTEPGSGGAGIGAFLIDGARKGFQRHPGFDLIGQHTIGTGAFSLESYVAREEELRK